MFSQAVRVLSGQVGEAAIFRPVPYQFVRVQFGRIGRQLLREDFGMFGQKLLDVAAFVVHRPSIPHHRERATKRFFQFTQEVHDVRTLDIVRQKLGNTGSDDRPWD